METFVVRFKGGAEQTFEAERVMQSGERDTLRVVLFPTQVSELASNVDQIFRVVFDRTGRRSLQPRWPHKEQE
jgi:hypothetical protein